ncbi:ATP-binding protein [Ectobacillus sp. sgz5001026]|uniref:sensor histidine kinase n=1 Tax=Ectobacillus sp. sgz5001026 TaxID=3242473 RepID=UPI0036D4313A
MIALLTGVKSSKKSYYTELKKTVEQLKKKNMQLEIINEVMKSIKIDMTLEDILKNMVTKLKVLVQFDRLSLLLLQGDRLTLTNVYPEHSHYFDVGTTIPNNHSLYWSALKKRQIIFTRFQDPHTSFYEEEYLTLLHLKTILVLPIYSKNNGIGVLSIGRLNESAWGIDDLAFLEQLTDHLAVSIENAQLFNEVLRGKQTWEDTFKAVEDMIIVFDKNLQVLQFNDSVKDFFTINEQSPDFSILVEPCRTLVTETFHSQKPGYKEMYFKNHFTCEMYTYPVHNNDQQVYGVIAYIKDVTKKRKMEVQLLHSGKLAAIGEMAAGVAHELNSPLTAILGNSQLLLREIASTSPTYTLLNDIKNCGIRCKQIIKSLLTFSRQDEYTFSSCSLNEAVEQVLNLLKYQLETQQINITLLLQENLPVIEGSQPQIEQIIINLLLNAKDALTSRTNKEIIIQTSSYQNEVHLSVKDNGVGIEENRLSEIFHPFHTIKESEKGTGLGLSVSIGIAKAHNGTIQVKSQLNIGSTFTLKLPVQQQKIVEVMQ